MANEKISEYANSVSELEDADLLDVSKDIGGGNFESQKMTGAILRGFYRSGSIVITGSPQTVAFSSDLANTDYEVFIIDPDGIGFEDLGTFTVSGFDINGIIAGTMGYIAILNN